jgi:hypothetical protein
MATTVRKGSDRPGAKKATAKKVVAKKTAARTPAAPKRAAAKKSAAKRPAARKAPRKRTTRGITPAQAIANTRRLLEEKQAHDRESPPWQALEGRHGHEPHAGGFQDAQARDRANELHAGESHLEAIQGAVGTRDRHNQGKRDQR